MIQALAGGALVGLAAALLMLLHGRIAGISGITYSALWGGEGGRSWRVIFIAGLVAGGWLALLMGHAIPDFPLPDGGGTLGLLLMAGFLVGVGTRLGNGCTSGHGVCGLARHSTRSWAATLTFMGVGMTAATLLRPWLAGVLG